MPGAIEGEKMRIVKSTGTPGPQDWDDDSGGQHLWWHGGQKPGDELLLEFNVPKAGQYQVFGRFLKAIDYGIMQLAVNGKKAGEPIDFFHDGVIHTARDPLGHVRPSARPEPAFRRRGRGESEGPEAIHVRAGLYSDQAKLAGKFGVRRFIAALVLPRSGFSVCSSVSDLCMQLTYSACRRTINHGCI